MPPINQREDVKAKIVEFAKLHFPEEACGFIIETAGKRFVVMDCENIHRKPRSDFKTHGDDWERAESLGKIAAIWHSHPNRRATASDADKAWSEELEVPYLIYATPADTWDYYEPSGWVAPRIGRPFVYGILDCYATVRDYYRTELGIQLPYFPSDDNWWTAGKNLFLENFAAAGFIRVDNLQKHDGILMSTSHNAVNHCGVYLGGGMMLHHPPHRPSVVIPYLPNSSAYYARCTYGYYRHSDLVK